MECMHKRLMANFLLPWTGIQLSNRAAVLDVSNVTRQKDSNYDSEMGHCGGILKKMILVNTGGSQNDFKRSRPTCTGVVWMLFSSAINS